MAAATANRDGQRQPGDIVQYSGASGIRYFKNTLIMKNGPGVILPVAQGAGASNARFLGVAANEVNMTGNLGASNFLLNLWKKGEFTFVAQGTGVSAHIGQRAYALDDQTVGVSAATPVLYVGEITAIPTTSSYRVIIDQAINGEFVSGLSGFSTQN
jgi:hypothetical protein